MLSRADVLWQRGLLALCALGLVQVGTMLAMKLHVSDAGFHAQPTAVPYVDRIVVEPAGAAAASGLLTGDLLDTRALEPAARWRLASYARLGDPLTVPIERDGAQHVFTIVTNAAVPITWDQWMFFATQVWIAAFCALLAWRRPGSSEVRVLALFYLMSSVLGQSGWVTQSAYFDMAARSVDSVILWGSFGLIVVYAQLFGRPISTFRRVLGWLAYASILTTLGIMLTHNVALLTGLADPFVPLRVRRSLLLVASMLPLFAAIGAARGAERTRVIWATVALAPVCLWTAATDVVPALVPMRDIVTNVGFFIMPCVLTYSLLNRRLTDIGFIVNRAAIFTAVSVVLVGSFVLVEWLLADWLRDASHTTNVLFGAGLALALGFSMRFVHARVDRVVDGVFFRKRHEDEEAIRTFAYEAPYITDAATLLERAASILDRHTNASFVEIVLQGVDGRFAGFDENDPAFVRLRATRKVADLHGLDSQLRGDLIFPMVARGNLRGVVVLGPRSSGESYAPDETAAIAQLGHSLGAALDVLAAKHDDPRDAILDELRSLREMLLQPGQASSMRGGEHSA